jgi:hypothetical protein
MMDLHSATEKARNMLSDGLLSDLTEANIEIVRMMGVRIITGRVPADSRKALNAGVKSGKLGKLKKDGLKPEAYFHPNSKANAIAARNKIAAQSIAAIQSVCG